MNFDTAANRVKQLNIKPSNEDMLQLYALYKQVTVGDINTECPSFWDLIGKAKWNAWKDLEGTDEKSASERYVDLVNSLVEKDT